jgi:transcriptional regulator with XRE-family HTH domain
MVSNALYSRSRAMPVLPQSVGERIKLYRLAQKMTQAELSARMQARGHDTLTRERIGDVERGRRVVKPEEFVSFARVLGIPITTLFGVPDYAPE